MKLPGAGHAVVNFVKLVDYCLNPIHPRGRHKARVFASAFGLTRADALWLSEQLLRAARDEDAMKAGEDEYASDILSILGVCGVIVARMFGAHGLYAVANESQG